MNRTKFIDSRSREDLRKVFEGSRDEFELWYHATLELFFHMLINLDFVEAAMMLHTLEAELNGERPDVTDDMNVSFQGALAAFAWFSGFPHSSVARSFTVFEEGLYEAAQYDELPMLHPVSVGESLVRVCLWAYQACCFEKVDFARAIRATERLVKSSARTPVSNSEKGFHCLTLAIMRLRCGEVLLSHRDAMNARTLLVDVHERWKWIADLAVAFCQADLGLIQFYTDQRERGVTNIAEAMEALVGLRTPNKPFAIRMVSDYARISIALRQHRPNDAKKFRLALSEHLVVRRWPTLESDDALLPRIGREIQDEMG